MLQLNAAANDNGSGYDFGELEEAIGKEISVEMMRKKACTKPCNQTKLQIEIVQCSFQKSIIIKKR
ncbi:hypothetical protein MTR_3g045040 [Medicago truncatula]|uniref:Uncharacterized protein n=1 Tax=Medicago truncatula TaxID=3880 RepID=A0A072UWS8_MEDTR|nr:hypothetical protein MTR_3g045040 [Medicago truncatula]